jgi:hypothetical protein
MHEDTALHCIMANCSASITVLVGNDKHPFHLDEQQLCLSFFLSRGQASLCQLLRGQRTFPGVPYILGIVRVATIMNPSIVDLYYIVRQSPNTGIWTTGQCNTIPAIYL